MNTKGRGYLRKTIDKTLRAELAKNFHLNDQFSWNLTHYLLIQSLTKPNKEIRLSDCLLGACAGINRTSFRGKTLLDKFAINTLDLRSEKRVEQSDSSEGKKDSKGWIKMKGNIKTPRILISKPYWPQSVIDTYATSRTNGGVKVIVISGEPYTRKKKAEFTKQVRLEALENPVTSKTVIGEILLNLINKEAPKRFIPVLKNMPEAIKEAMEQKDSLNQLEILDTISEVTQPFYKSVKKSTRIYAVGNAITGLRGDVRRALTKNWHEADLRSAQLTVLAKNWGVTSLQKFLGIYGHYWKYLLEEMGWNESKENKKYLKQLTYALAYGASKGFGDEGGDEDRKKGLLGVARHHSQSEESVDKFMKIPLVKDILKAQKEQFRKIIRDGGASDCFGTWIQYEQGFRTSNKRSVLAQQSQSYELGLLSGVIRWFASPQSKSYSCFLVLWQHDGFSFTCRQSIFPTVAKKLIQLVDAESNKMDIFTELEIDKK